MKKALGIIALSLLMVIGTWLTSKDAKSSRATAPPAAKYIASVQEKTGEYVLGIGVPIAKDFHAIETKYSGDQFGVNVNDDAIVYIISPSPATVIGVFLQFGTSNDYAHVTGPPAGRIYDA